MSKEIDNLSDIEDILAGDDEVLPPVTKEEEEEKEVKEKKDEEENLEEIDLSKEGDEEELNLSGEVNLPQFKEITKKYPEFFKDFPNLRNAFFQEKEYRGLFNTVEAAKEAKEDVEGLRELESAIARGEENDIVGVLDAIKDLGEEAVANFSVNFLPALRKVNQDAYYEAITPELVNFTRSMFDAGVRNGNDSLKNAALHAAHYFFKDQKVASGEKDIIQPTKKQKEPENNELKNERANFQRERFTTLMNDVTSESNSKVMDLIMDGIDPRDTMTDGMKTLVAEKVAKEIDDILGKNTSHRSKMDNLWKKASEAGFSVTHKNKIITAYLESVKQILPKVRSKVRSSALGTRERHSETGDLKKEERTEERTTRTSRTTPSKSNSHKNGKTDDDIDWSKTTDLQYIQNKITYKS